MPFINIFLKTLGILLGFTTFIIIISLVSNLLDYNTQNYRTIKGEKSSKNIIAILNLNGPILNNLDYSLIKNVVNYINPEDIKKYLSELQTINPKILIIKINSPGGTVSSSVHLEKIINDYKRENNTKIYFYTNGLLASGGYWAATTGDKIYANYGSIIGSIGVSGPSWYYYDKPTAISTGLIGQKIETKNGIQIYNQSAGSSKDLYNPFRKPTNEELQHLQRIVEDIYDDFLLKVSKSRKIEVTTLKNDIGALIFNSNQAKEKFLIDGVIDFEELINNIIKTNGYNNYKLIEINIRESIFNKYLVSFLKPNYTSICNQLNTNFISLLPTFLNKC